MKISVKVKANAKTEKVERVGDGTFLVQVKEKPQDGRANYAVREAMADYFNISKSRVVLVRGDTSKNKIFEIDF